MKKKLLVGLTTGFFILVMVGTASATLVNFDSHASTILVSSGTPPASSVVTDDYADLGVVFGRFGLSDGVAVVNNTNTFSGPNGASGLDASGKFVENSIGDIYFNFVDTANSLLMATTDVVSFYLGDGGTDMDMWDIYVYDQSDILLEKRSVASISNFQLSFTYSNIHRFWIDWTAGTTTGYLLDDLKFNTPTSSPVSEPATMFLFGTGLVGLAGISIRRKKK